MNNLLYFGAFGLCAISLLGCGSNEGAATDASSGPASVPSPVESVSPEPSEPSSNQKSRRFRFHYRFALSGIEPNKLVRVWLPVPESNEYQDIQTLPYKLPADPSFNVDAEYKNRILYVEATSPANGNLTFDVPYEVTRREVLALKVEKTVRPIEDRQRKLFLKANSKVPVDGKPLDLLSGTELDSNSFRLANQLYEIVDNHVAYNKDGEGWGNGNVLWVCDSKRGNCTDFHSLFISLARSQGIPARFEIGFPIPAEEAGKVGGYHCWAWFFDKERGWIPVDISEADKHPELKNYYFGSLTPDRLTFSVGRDIKLVPEPAQKSLNYFVYPHVEVDDKPVSRSNIDLQFSYENVTAIRE